MWVPCVDSVRGDVSNGEVVQSVIYSVHPAVLCLLLQKAMICATRSNLLGAKCNFRFPEYCYLLLLKLDDLSFNYCSRLKVLRKLWLS